MAITSAICTSFKEELFQEGHTFGDAGTSPIGGDTYKLFLFKATVSGTFGAATANYSEVSTDEATDTSSPQGYSSGGGTLTNGGAAVSGTTAYVDFADITFSSVTLSSDGCGVYNSTNGNKTVFMYNFGSTKTASGGDFTVTFPTPDASNAIIRLA